LQQRQEEWKSAEEAKKEAEKNSWIPTGHVLLAEPERIDTLKTLKGSKYICVLCGILSIKSVISFQHRSFFYNLFFL